jgi:hypothetical protein
MEILAPLSHTAQIQEYFNQVANRGKRRSKDFTFHALYILATLKRKTTFKKETLNGYHLLNKEVLTSIISLRQFSHIISYLTKTGLIDVNNKHVKGVHSKGYRLTPLALSERWGKMEVKDRLLVSKLNTWQLKYEAESKQQIAKRGGGYKVSNWWLQELKIDAKAALNYIEPFEPGRYDVCKQQIESISKKKFRVAIDINGRFHHNLTNLKKELRQYLTINNEPLIGFDVVNSQPTFLSILLTSIGYDSDDLKQYTTLCSNGTIYEHLNGKNFASYSERKAFKNKLFSSVFFGKVSNMNTTIGLKFKDSFPGIFEAIKKLKNDNGTNYIANRLQGIEAKFIFDLIKYINVEVGDDVPLISLHDAIYTTENNVDVLETLCFRYSQIKENGLIKFSING